jgi:mRNA interferase MazF
MNCSRNDIVLLPIPFTDLTSRKVRPAIVLGQNGSNLFLVPVSSQMANTDFAVREWRAAGLNVPCGMKAQIATIDKRLVAKIVGSLDAADVGVLNAHLRIWLQLDPGT